MNTIVVEGDNISIFIDEHRVVKMYAKPFPIVEFYCHGEKVAATNFYTDGAVDMNSYSDIVKHMAIRGNGCSVWKR